MGAEHGLIIVFTGNGKGKTTSALGMALRAAGHDMRVGVIQFIKGSWHYGELDAAKMLEGRLDIFPMGKGLVFRKTGGPTAEDRKAMSEAMDAAGQMIASGDYDMVVLDEINVVASKGYVPVEDVRRLMADKPEDLHLVLTGRGAPEEVIAEADLVTEMNEVKHPFRKGVKAQKGVEF